MQEITGACLCGAVRYRIAAEPLMVRVCWCRVCQYLAAGGGTVNVAVPAAALDINGALTDYVCTADSGNIMHRRFCPTCGTPVLAGSEARPDVIIVRAGTLDDPSIARPRLTIWTDSAPAWACFDPALPTSPRQPAPLPKPPV